MTFEYSPAEAIVTAQHAERIRVARRRRRIGLAGFLLTAVAAIVGAPGAMPPNGGERDPGWGLGEASLVEVDDPRAGPRPDSRRESDPQRAPRAQLDGASALRARIDVARRWAAEQPGAVSFALVGRDGALRGHQEGLLYPSASVVKAMLLAAEMLRLEDGELPLDRATRATLTSMITYSDNAAADLIYARVGDAGLLEVAERVGMHGFSVATSWGYAEINAADMALLFARLDRALPRSNREFAKGLLGSVVPEQSWGIPAAVPASWAVRFKGGWRPTESGQLVHQAAELRDGNRGLSVAILTDGQPSMETGIATIEGIASRLIPGRQSG